MTAKAEHYARTLCLAHERVSNDPTEWLLPAELDEARALIPGIVKATRAALNRQLKPLRKQLGDIPRDGFYAWFDDLTVEQKQLFEQHGHLVQHRSQLNDAATRATGEYVTASDLLFLWGRICVAAKAVDAATVEAKRLNELARSMGFRRDCLAAEALQSAIRREIDKRNSDNGWADELERRASIEAGPLVTRH